MAVEDSIQDVSLDTIREWEVMLESVICEFASLTGTESLRAYRERMKNFDAQANHRRISVLIAAYGYKFSQHSNGYDVNHIVRTTLSHCNSDYSDIVRKLWDLSENSSVKIREIESHDQFFFSIQPKFTAEVFTNLMTLYFMYHVNKRDAMVLLRRHSCIIVENEASEWLDSFKTLRSFIRFILTFLGQSYGDMRSTLQQLVKQGVFNLSSKSLDTESFKAWDRTLMNLLVTRCNKRLLDKLISISRFFLSRSSSLDVNLMSLCVSNFLNSAIKAEKLLVPAIVRFEQDLIDTAKSFTCIEAVPVLLFLKALTKTTDYASFLNCKLIPMLLEIVLADQNTILHFLLRNCSRLDELIRAFEAFTKVHQSMRRPEELATKSIDDPECRINLLRSLGLNPCQRLEVFYESYEGLLHRQWPYVPLTFKGVDIFKAWKDTLRNVYSTQSRIEIEDENANCRVPDEFAPLQCIMETFNGYEPLTSLLWQEACCRVLQSFIEGKEDQARSTATETWNLVRELHKIASLRPGENAEQKLAYHGTKQIFSDICQVRRWRPGQRNGPKIKKGHEPPPVPIYMKRYNAKRKVDQRKANKHMWCNLLVMTDYLWPLNSAKAVDEGFSPVTTQNWKLPDHLYLKDTIDRVIEDYAADMMQLKRIELLPMLSTGTLHIHQTDGTTTQVTLSLFDISLLLVMKERQFLNETNETRIIEVSELLDMPYEVTVGQVEKLVKRNILSFRSDNDGEIYISFKINKSSDRSSSDLGTLDVLEEMPSPLKPEKSSRRDTICKIVMANLAMVDQGYSSDRFDNLTNPLARGLTPYALFEKLKNFESSVEIDWAEFTGALAILVEDGFVINRGGVFEITNEVV